MTLNRRDIIRLIGATASLTVLPTLSMPTGASTPAKNRFVFVMLRGGMDGLHAFPKLDDPHYQALRGSLTDGVSLSPLHSGFSVHPELDVIYDLFHQNQALIIHSVASAYKTRSHFDAQDVLELGTLHLVSSGDGWLGRAANHMAGDNAAIAIAQSLPLALRGGTGVSSWAPSKLPKAEADLIERLGDLYQNHPQLAEALQAATAADETAMMIGGSGQPSNATTASLAEAAGKLLSTGNNYQMAMMELGGWDTHNGQKNRIAGQLRKLNTLIKSLRAGLGDEWQNTVIAIATEFGRTAAVNGTNGTDHGTASTAILAGGAVRGGQIVGHWAGLDTLYEGRDITPTTDIRSLFKSVMVDHLGLSDTVVNNSIFPDSHDAKRLTGLIRT